MQDFESLRDVRWECKYHVVFIPKSRPLLPPTGYRREQRLLLHRSQDRFRSTQPWCALRPVASGSPSPIIRISLVRLRHPYGSPFGLHSVARLSHSCALGVRLRLNMLWCHVTG